MMERGCRGARRLIEGVGLRGHGDLGNKNQVLGGKKQDADAKASIPG
jgi:hypothetical protein